MRQLFNHRFANALLLCASITISTLILEFGLRYTELFSTYMERNSTWKESFLLPTRGYKSDSWYHVFSPNTLVSHKRKEFKYSYVSGPWGLRETKTSFEHRSPISTRIIVLGDSYTEGVGTPSDSTWAKLMQEHLQDSFDVQTFNAGVSGSDPWFEYVLLRDTLIRNLSPTHVIVAVNPSDIADFAVRGGMERFRADGTLDFSPLPFWEPIYRFCHVSRFFFKRLGYDDLLFTASDIEKRKASFVTAFEQLITRYERLATLNEFEVVYVFFPSPADLKHLNVSGLYDYSVLRQLGLKLSARGVKTIDLYDEIHEIIGADPHYHYSWPIDGHYNSKGYHVLGTAIAGRLQPIIEGELILPEHSSADSLCSAEY